MRTDATAFSWEFLRDVMRWSWIAAIVVGIAGTVLTGSAGFAVGFAVAAAVDVLTLELAIRRGREALEEHAITAFSPGLVGLRLGVKAVLLVVAALVVAESAAFWGVVAGVLVVDTTVLVVGSIAATSRAFHSGDAAGGQKGGGGDR